MFRSSLLVIIVFALFLPSLLHADDNLDLLERVAEANGRAPTGLMNYLVAIEPAKAGEKPGSLSGDLPQEIRLPDSFVMTKFWQRDGKKLVFADRPPAAADGEKLAMQLSDILAVEVNQMLLPADRLEERRELFKAAKVKLSEVALAGNLLLRLEITFDKPADLNDAFYAKALSLPQKQISAMTFDIDSRTSTLTEMSLVTAGGLRLTVEVRYLEAAGCCYPERFRITSPDGKVDDLLEIKFAEVDGYLMPTSLLREIRRPELLEKLEILFRNYRVNQPVPDEIRVRLDNRP